MRDGELGRKCDGISLHKILKSFRRDPSLTHVHWFPADSHSITLHKLPSYVRKEAQ